MAISSSYKTLSVSCAQHSRRTTSVQLMAGWTVSQHLPMACGREPQGPHTLHPASKTVRQNPSVQKLFGESGIIWRKLTPAGVIWRNLGQPPEHPGDTQRHSGGTNEALSRHPGSTRERTSRDPKTTSAADGFSKPNVSQL